MLGRKWGYNLSFWLENRKGHFAVSWSTLTNKWVPKHLSAYLTPFFRMITFERKYSVQSNVSPFPRLQQTHWFEVDKQTFPSPAAVAHCYPPTALQWICESCSVSKPKSTKRRTLMLIIIDFQYFLPRVRSLHKDTGIKSDWRAERDINRS